MAQIHFIGIIDHASGKVCTHSDTSFAFRKKSRRTYTCRRENEYEHTPTMGQLQQQVKFKQQREAVAAFIKKVKAMPTSIVNGKPVSPILKLNSLYNADSNAYSLQGFVWRHFDFDENTIKVGGVTYNSEMLEAGTSETPGTSGTGSQSRMFALNISSANTDQGAVNDSVNKTYTEGSRVTIVATPKEGYAFNKWSDGNTQASRQVTMTNDITLVASFVAASGSNPGGSGVESM